MSNSPDSRRLWLAGCGPIHHGQQTQQRIAALAAQLVASGRVANEERCYAMLAAADRLTCAGMNVVAHMTYAKRIDLDGEPLGVDDFKPTPEGHTGGSLNMVPAFVGYLDRKSTRLNSSHVRIPYAVFCLKKKKKEHH